MEFKLISYTIGAEVNLNEDEYSNIITMVIGCSIEAVPNFSKDIEVISTNDMTGFEVDAQRLEAIETYINNLNKS